MADVTITGLPNASALTGAERVPMDQGGTTVDAAASAIAALATKATVGLGSVDNTSDANKPISAATQTALDGKASTGSIGSSGLTQTAGVLGRESGTGAPQAYPLGSGLSIVNGVLTVTAAGSGTVTSVGLSVPTGLSVTGSPISTSGTLALAFAAGYSLPTTAKQTEWDTAYSERLRWDGSSTGLNAVAGRASLNLGTAALSASSDFATAAQGTDSREWSATTISQAEAEAGIATTRRAFTAQRVFQAVAAYIAANFSAVGQALATAANAAAGRASLGLGTAATAASGDFAPAAQGVTNGNNHDHSGGDGAQIAYGSLSGLPTVPALSSSAPQPLGATAAAGSSADAARIDHVHARSTYAELGAIADGIIFTISNRGETASPSTNYDESLPLSFASTVTKVTFITHIDNTGSSTTTLSAYKKTAAGTKTSLLSANATLASGASVAVGSLSGTAGVLSLAAGDRFGVDLIGLGTGASGIKCIIEYTRSAV